MNEEQVKALLETSGIPFAYHVWASPPPLPWGVFRFSEQNAFYADGVLYYAVSNCQIELYTDTKQPDTEQKLEGVLTAAGISYTKFEYYIESEKLYQILYECEV